MNNCVREKLFELIDKYGKSLSEDFKRCNALLLDFCGEYRKEINVLINAIKEGIPSYLILFPDNLPIELALNRLVKKLEDNLGMSESAAFWAVQTWAMALGKISRKNESKQTLRKDIKTKDTKKELIKTGSIRSEQSVKSHPISNHKPSIQLTGYQFIKIPAGEFIMGNDEKDADDWEKPQHKVYLDDYYIGMYPVTNKEYSLFIEAGGYEDPQYWEKEVFEWLKRENIKEPRYLKDERFNKNDQPVVGISWYEAMAYCKWSSCRLPTEAEWEKAARGKDGRKYPWGNQKPDNTYCNFGMNVGTTTIVGNYPKGKSPYGCYDMLGNVMEWVYDCYDSNYYKNSPYKNPKNIISPNYPYRVIRGGSFLYNINDIRVTLRSSFNVFRCFYDIGFRCCK